MKIARTRTIPFIVTVFLVLAISAMQVVPALADDAAPPPPEVTEVAPPAQESTPEAPPLEPAEVPVTVVEEVPPTAEPVVSEEQASPVVETQAEAPVTQPETPAEVLAQVPDGTQIVVLDENGDALPLVSAEAAEVIYTGDPIWCPLGVAPKPGIGGCTPTQPNLATLIDKFQTGLLPDPNANGVIWITGFLTNGAGGPGVADSSVSPIVIDGDNVALLGSWGDFSLTLKGGWTGTATGVINTGDASVFNVPISIINWNASVTLNDIVITGVGTDDALTVTTTKDIVLTRVKSNNNTGDEGAHLDNSGGTGKVTISSSEFKQNSGIYGLYVRSHGAITLTNVLVSQNNSSNGAWLDNCVDLGAGCTTTVASGVTLNGSTFSDNRYAGLIVISRGLITASNLTANGNGIWASSGGGVILDNAQTGATAGVTLTGTNIFTDNYSTGLSVYSKGAIRLNNLIANGNDSLGYGANLDNSGSLTAQPITLTGTNQFKYNYNAGLKIASKGLITLNNVNASGSLAGYGVQIDQCVQVGPGCTGSALGGVKLTGTNFMNDNYLTGLYIDSVGALTLNNLTASGNGSIAGIDRYGAYLTNTSAVTPKAVTLTGTNVFNGNSSGGLYIASKGNIVISNLTASGNTHGLGAELQNNGTGGAGGITLSGTNRFDGNSSTGLEVDSLGAITIAAVTATGNGTSGFGSGVVLDNVGGSSKPVTITGASVFSSNNRSGLTISSAGVIKLNSVTASDNTNGYGVEINSSYNSASIAAVVLSGTNTFNNNGTSGYAGLYIDASGIITLSSVKANANSGYGVMITNTDSGSSTPRNISLTGANTFTGNAFSGLEIHTYGTISLANVTATGNGLTGSYGFGVLLDNSSGATLVRGITLTGTNILSGNYNDGLSVASLGQITLSNVTASNNVQGSGANISNDIDGAAGGVTLSGTQTFEGNYNDGLNVDTRGAITINNLRANNNSDYGATLDNVGTSSLAVTLTGTTIVNGNHNTGLMIQSSGQVTASNIMATGSTGGYGVRIQNSSGTAGVTLTGVNTFSNNYGYGLLVSSKGTLNLLTTSLTASDNGILSGIGYGVALMNDAAGTPQAVKLTGTSVINGNYGGGLYISSLGTITMNNLTASYNTHGMGVEIYDSFGSSVGAVTLTGTNTFEGNFGTGLLILAKGAITASNVTASNNGISASDGYGACLVNSGAGTPQAIKLTGSNIFNGNYSAGLYLESRGAVTANNLTASENEHGSGAVLRNEGDGAVGGITLTGTNTFNGNFYAGLDITSRGTLTINNLNASTNGSSGLGGLGAHLDNRLAGASHSIKLTGANTFNGNYEGGLSVYTLGSTTINNLNANNNINGSGVRIDPGVPGAGGTVTLTGFTNANGNYARGIHIVTLGNVSLTKVTAGSNQTSDGLFVMTSGNITLTCGTFTSNGGDATGDGIELTTTLTTTLTGVFAFGNPGENLNLWGASGPRVIVRNCPLP